MSPSTLAEPCHGSAAIRRGLRAKARGVAPSRADHPCELATYSPLHAFWEASGRRRVAREFAMLGWKVSGQPLETDRPMQVRIRGLCR